MFQHTAARRRLEKGIRRWFDSKTFQHTAARRRLGLTAHQNQRKHCVSTHSRPKAAGSRRRCGLSGSSFQHTAARRRLGLAPFRLSFVRRFQHTAARRRLAVRPFCRYSDHKFQHTAARRRLGRLFAQARCSVAVSTHSRPKAAGN